LFEQKIMEVIHYVHDMELKRNEIVTGYIGDVIITFLIDSGSPINTVTEDVWAEIIRHKVPVRDVKSASECNREFHAYGSHTPLKVIARFNSKLKVDHLECEAVFFVIQNAKKSLISKATGEQMGLLRVGLEILHVKGSNMESIKPFPLLPVKPISLHIDSKVIPVKQQYYRVPAALQDRTTEKLKWMLDADIIEKVNEPVDWISPMLVIPKSNGDIRICIDMRAANKAIKRINHPMPNLDQFRIILNEFKIFSKIDMTSAYHHIPLSVESRKITTFWSNIGLLRYKRLMFGMNAAPELFQGMMEQLFSNIDGVVIYLDDILVGGKDVSDHDQRLNKVMDILKNNSLSLNEDKCEYRKNEIEFMGLMMSAKGISISPRKVEAVAKFRTPKNSDEVRSFLGLINYMSPFVGDLANKTSLLRKLLTNKFEWTKEEQKSFDELKQEIINCTMALGYYSKEDETYLYTDASGEGLGAVLVQKGSNQVNRVITCISRSLSKTEQQYPQVHREALAIVWAMKRLYYYLIGRQFTLYTDNQALKFIFGQHKDLTKRACNRAAMYALELQMFSYNVEHVPGKQNISDVLSRLVTKDQSVSINSIEWPDESCFAITTEMIKKETLSDESIQLIIRAIEESDWSNPQLKSFRVFKEEIYLWDGIVWKGDRIILPKSLRQNALQIAHLGHPGAISMKRMLRNRVWWPDMDEDVKQLIKSCNGCILVERTDPPEPLKMTVMPEYTWQHLAIDFFDASAHNIHLLVIVDYHSRYVCIKTMNINKTVNEVINKLEELFAMFDYPASIKSDNGPPFNSEAFANYCKSRGIKLNHSIPLWPQSNGEVEVQNKGIKRILQIAIAQKEDWKKALQVYTSSYNKRPHSVTGKAPIELMMNRNTRNLLPETKENYNSIDKEGIFEKDMIKKDEMKRYADKKRNAKESSIEKEDIVLMKNKRVEKLQPNFNQTRFKVIDQVGKKSKIEGPNGEIYERCTTELKKIIDKTEEKKENQEENIKTNEQVTEKALRPVRTKRLNPKYSDYVIE
jgi:transposase InsO family protein